jgi:hypothetical protein
MGAKDIDMAGHKLPINEFKLEYMVAYPSIVMVAKRGSGKSVVRRAILNHFKDIPVGNIIAPTDEMNTFYGKFFADSYIHYEYKSEIIEKLLIRQQKIIEKAKQRKLQGKKVDARAFIVMDDCLADKASWIKDRPIRQLLFNGRHYEIMYILTMQFPLGISPELRGNFDYIFLLAEDFVSNQKRIHDHYAGMFPSFESFKQVFAALTEDFGCMVIVNRGARKSFLEKVYWYKAPMMEDCDVKIGCKEFLKFHDKNYNEDWRHKHNVFNVEEYCIKKKKEKSLMKIEKVPENPVKKTGFGK